MMFQRLLSDKLEDLISRSRNILLLGPRQTGKSTLIEELLKTSKKKTLIYGLQHIKTFEEVAKDPSSIAREVDNLFQKITSLNLFIDEVQKIPILLDDCQYLIDKYKKNICVILTGSSARKLRARGVNLLPGRIIVKNLYPLIFPEITNFSVHTIVPIKTKKLLKTDRKINLDEILIFGSLPGIVSEEKDKEDILSSYVTTYLQEEIRAEALTRNIGHFSRFLELAALESGLTPNFTKLSNETGIPLGTIKNYFQLLEDTLITFSIPPFKGTKKTRKQVLSTPKYIFFDLGIRNASSGLPLTKRILRGDIAGNLFEQFIILELIRRIKYFYPYWRYFFWRTNTGLEVDFIVQTEDEIIPIEIKYTSSIHRKHIKHLEIFMEEYKCKKGYLVGLFPRAQKLTDKIDAIPWSEI